MTLRSADGELALGDLYLIPLPEIEPSLFQPQTTEAQGGYVGVGRGAVAAADGAVAELLWLFAVLVLAVAGRF